LRIADQLSSPKSRLDTFVLRNAGRDAGSDDYGGGSDDA
jgi:hypothetical protein